MSSRSINFAVTLLASLVVWGLLACSNDSSAVPDPGPSKVGASIAASSCPDLNGEYQARTGLAKLRISMRDVGGVREYYYNGHYYQADGRWYPGGGNWGDLGWSAVCDQGKLMLQDQWAGGIRDFTTITPIDRDSFYYELNRNGSATTNTYVRH